MRNLNLLLRLIMTLGITACSPKYYTPNTQNIPLITHKGERDFSLSFDANQFNLQGAYGIAENFAVKVNGFIARENSASRDVGGSAKFIEIGGGYFKPLSDNFVFEAYGITGVGSVENHFNYISRTLPSNPSTIGQLTAKTFRIGIQPNFGYKSKYFSAAFSGRFVNLRFSNIKGDLIYENEKQVDYLKANASNFLIEPAFTIRGGFEHAKLQVQYGHSFNLSNHNFKQEDTFLTIGINVNLK